MTNCRDAALSNTWNTLRLQCNKEPNENEKRRRKKIMVGWKIEKECRKKKAAKRLFMTNVAGLLLARFLVIFPFIVVFLAELHARRFAVLGYFWCDFPVIFFFQSTVLRFSESKYAVILNFMTRWSVKKLLSRGDLLRFFKAWQLYKFIK